MYHKVHTDVVSLVHSSTVHVVNTFHPLDRIAKRSLKCSQPRYSVLSSLTIYVHLGLWKHRLIVPLSYFGRLAQSGILEAEDNA